MILGFDDVSCVAMMSERIPIRCFIDTIHRIASVSVARHHHEGDSSIMNGSIACILLALAASSVKNTCGFVIDASRRTKNFRPLQSPFQSTRVGSPSSSLSTPKTVPFARFRNEDDEDMDERELVKVPRGRRRGKYYNDDSEDPDEYDVVSPRDRSYSDQETRDYDDDDEDEEWLDEDQLEEELSDLFENVVIPNPLLDSMDPDGAADRFLPELARDPRFWVDLALFIAFLNFVSWAGPRDTLSDLPWWY